MRRIKPSELQELVTDCVRDAQDSLSGQYSDVINDGLASRITFRLLDELYVENENESESI